MVVVWTKTEREDFLLRRTDPNEDAFTSEKKPNGAPQPERDVVRNDKHFSKVHSECTSKREETNMDNKAYYEDRLNQEPSPTSGVNRVLALKSSKRTQKKREERERKTESLVKEKKYGGVNNHKETI